LTLTWSSTATASIHGASILGVNEQRTEWQRPPCPVKGITERDCPAARRSVAACGSTMSDENVHGAVAVKVDVKVDVNEE
jgi:hypothetical protein